MTEIPREVRLRLGWAAYGLLVELNDSDLSEPIPYDQLETDLERRAAVKTLIARCENAGYLRKEKVQLGFGVGTGWRFTVYPAGDAPPTEA